MAGLVLAGSLWVPTAAPAAGFLTGQLLVAGQNLDDSNFSKTVILIVRHDPSGALGLVVNKPMRKVPLNRLLQVFEGSGNGKNPVVPQQQPGEPSGDGASLPVFYGGPVDSFLGFTLHSRDVMPANSEALGDDIALNVQDDILQALAKGAGPRHVVFLLGYAGWGPGQLESELTRGDWRVVKADPDLIFSDDPSRTWERAMARISTNL